MVNVMGLSFRSLTGVLVLVAAASGFPFAAIAQPTSSTQPSSNETIAETFNRAFFANDPEFFRNRSFGRQLDLILGPGSLIRNSFPENEIIRDAERVDNLYEATLEQQVSSDPIIRTRDLPNPYETSILRSRSLSPNSRVQGRELIFDALPPQ